MGTIAEIAVLLEREYQQRGYPVADLAKLPVLSTFPSAEGCRVVTEFSDALAGMNEQRAAYILRSLVLASR